MRTGLLHVLPALPSANVKKGLLRSGCIQAGFFLGFPFPSCALAAVGSLSCLPGGGRAAAPSLSPLLPSLQQPPKKLPQELSVQLEVPTPLPCVLPVLGVSLSETQPRITPTRAGL